MLGLTTVYPFKITATFKCDNQVLKKMWTTGCRRIQHATAPICYKTAFGKQLQYNSDTRIQALSLLYLSGEERLMKKAILDFYLSCSPGQVVKGNHVGNRIKFTPTFSLLWISMIYDYWMHRKDDDFIVQFLPAIQEILDGYERQKKDHQEMLGAMKWWNVIDFKRLNGWENSPNRESARSAFVSLKYTYTLKLASKLFITFGNPERGKRYIDLAEKINEDTMRLCFNESKALIADTPDKLSYSQYANIWAVLSGAVEDKKAKKVMIHLLYDKSIEQATSCYRFYLIQALKKTGLHDHYHAQIKPWQHKMTLELNSSLEKFQPDYSDRSDWAAEPNYDFLATICGITSAAAAFERVQIQPVPGDLMDIEGTMQHPEGLISVKYKRIGKTGIRAEIDIPETLQGDFIWDGKMFQLHGGKQTIECSPVKELTHE